MVSPWWISPILWRIFALLVSCVGVPEYILSLHCTTGRKTGSRHIGIGWEKTSPCLAATVNLENQNWRWKLQTVSWRNVFRMNCVSSCRIEGVWVFYCGWPQVSRFSADGGQEWKTRLEAGERKGEIERRGLLLTRDKRSWKGWKISEKNERCFILTYSSFDIINVEVWGCYVMIWVTICFLGSVKKEDCNWEWKECWGGVWLVSAPSQKLLSARTVLWRRPSGWTVESLHSNDCIFTLFT